MKVEGLDKLLTDIAGMASAMDAESAGAPTAKKILTAAAQPIHHQMKANTTKDPKIISSNLHDALAVGPVKKQKTGGQRVTIGVHRKDWDEEDYYPAFVEYGHGGPAPAPAHPYIRPAYGVRQDEAYEIIREGLRDALDQQNKS